MFRWFEDLGTSRARQVWGNGLSGEKASKNTIGSAKAEPTGRWGFFWRKRRDSDSCLRHNGTSVVIADAPERRRAGESGRESYQTPRARKLTAEQEDELRQIAPGRSLRELSAHFGVSHETIRKALNDGARALSLSQPGNSRELADVA